MIYAVEIGDQKFVKIGFTDGEVARRIAELQTGCPFEIRELFSVDGSLRQEQSLHAALRVAFGRVRIPMPPNEWYPGRNGFFQGFLEHLRYGVDAGLAYAEGFNPSVRQGRSGASLEPNIRWPSLVQTRAVGGDVTRVDRKVEPLDRSWSPAALQ